MGVSRMQGTPWHIEYLRKPKDDTLVIPSGKRRKKRKKKKSSAASTDTDKYADYPDGYILSRKTKTFERHIKQPKKPTKRKPCIPILP